MPQVVSTAVTTSVTATRLDPVLIAATGSVAIATDNDGLISNLGGLRATILGSLVAGRFGVFAADPINQPISDNLLTIGATGSIQGGERGVIMGNGGQSIIRNSGLVQGRNFGITVKGQQVLIANQGEISGLTGAAISMIAYDVASVLTLDNYGTITGSSLLADNQASRIAVIGSTATDRITNAGLILGGVDLQDGNDFYDGRYGTIRLGAISLGLGDDTIWGGAGEETLAFGASGQAITVDLRLAEAQITGEGMDVILGVENVETGAASDKIIGNDAANALRSGGEADILDGGAGDDTLEGGTGDDALEGGLGRDRLDGGAGIDLAVFSGEAGARVSLLVQSAQETGYGLDTLIDIENLVGGSGDDRFTGDGEANRLTGVAGDDVLSGSGGDDTLEGGADRDSLDGGSDNDSLIGGDGNDTLQGGRGDDTLDGGAGVDTAVFSGNRAAYQISGSGSAVTVTGADGTDTVRDVRFLKFDDAVIALTNAAPTGLGLSATSVLENAPVNSVVATLSAQDADGDAVRYSLAAGSPFALVGNSLVVAQTLDFESVTQHSVAVQARDDYGGVTSQTFTITVSNAVETTPFTLRGGADADVLAGEAGNDTLYGGAGSDTLTGDAGRDVFVFDTRTGRTNVDVVTDFSVPGDSIWLDNTVFKALGGKGSLARPQKLASDAFVSAKRAQDKEDRIVYDSKSGKLYYDQDGTGSKAQVHIATLAQNLKIKHSDFFVV